MLLVNPFLLTHELPPDLEFGLKLFDVQAGISGQRVLEPSYEDLEDGFEPGVQVLVGADDFLAGLEQLEVEVPVGLFHEGLVVFFVQVGEAVVLEPVLGDEPLHEMQRLGQKPILAFSALAFLLE